MKNNNEDKHLCLTCKYHSGYPGQDLMCLYILRTEHRRPCDWRNCTAYSKGISLGIKQWASKRYEEDPNVRRDLKTSED